MRPVFDIASMAQRQLDGMTINRDMMARDVQALLALTCRYQAAVADLHKRLQAADAKSAQGFATTFDDLFKDIFK